MSIEALNWARKIHVGDSLAKSLLRAIADYADEQGHCFPSHGRLALDCEMSEDTVKRRIRQLEEIGLLVTFRCWCDENGRRNQEQRGRETSKEIRLALGKRIVAPAADAAPQDVDLGGAASTPSDAGEGVLPAPPGTPAAPPGGAVVHPPNEPSLKQEDSPPCPPPGGVDSPSEIGEEAKKRFDYFLTHCLGYRTQDPRRPLAMFVALSEAEQVACAAASPLHAAECTKLKKKSLDAWKLIRERFWTRYPEARLPEKPAELPPKVFYPEGGEAFNAVKAAFLIARVIEFRHDWDGPRRGVWRRNAPEPDLLALAPWHDAGLEELPEIAIDGSHEFAAWRKRLARWTGYTPEPRKIWTEPPDPSVHDLPFTHPEHRWRKHVMGLRVPWPWPPKKDGTVYAAGDGTDGDDSSSGEGDEA